MAVLAENDMILNNGTLVAVTDGEKLRLFHNKGHEPHIDLVEIDAPVLDAASTGSGGRHRSSTANPDGSRLREDNFAGSVAAYLNREALGNAHAHILVIADPRTLGEMRKHYQPSLNAKLVGEIGKDLVKHSVESIRSAVVYAIAGGRLAKHAIQPGIRDPGRGLAEVRGGIAAGDSIVTGATDGLQPGQSVGIAAADTAGH